MGNSQCWGARVFSTQSVATKRPMISASWLGSGTVLQAGARSLCSDMGFDYSSELEALATDEHISGC